MSEDEAAIRQIEILWDEAWNRHDSEALASLLSEDADFVTVIRSSRPRRNAPPAARGNRHTDGA